MKREIRAFQGRFGRVVLFDTDTPVVEHAHSQCHVLIKCCGADGQYVVNGEPAPFRDDNIVLVNPWVPHHNPRPAGGSVSRVLAFYIEPHWLFDHTRPASLSFGFARPFTKPSASISTRIRLLADGLAEMMIAKDAPDARIREILVGLIDQIFLTYGGGEPAVIPPSIGAVRDFRIRRAVSHMRDHVSKETGMAQLARVAGLSRSRFFELFRSDTGLSPRLYMDALCLDSATRTLVTTADPLAEIAKTLGFSAPAHFSRFFHQHTSVSPSEYRRAAVAIDASSADVRWISGDGAAGPH